MRYSNGIEKEVELTSFLMQNDNRVNVMVYDELFDCFLEYMGEESSSINELAKKKNVDAEDGMYIVFGVVVINYLLENIKDENEEIVDKIFEFFEKMAHSEDVMVCEVLEFTILEELASQDKETFDYCKKKNGRRDT